MGVMRAKMRVVSVEDHNANHAEDGTTKTGESLTLTAVAASSYPEDGSDENNSYSRWTPSADLTMHINNPELFGVFVEGEEVYLDFTKAG